MSRFRGRKDVGVLRSVTSFSWARQDETSSSSNGQYLEASEAGGGEEEGEGEEDEEDEAWRRVEVGLVVAYRIPW